MTVVPTTSRYVCRNCLDAISGSSKASYASAIYTSSRQKSTAANDSANASQFRIAKHYGKLKGTDKTLDKHFNLPGRVQSTTWASGLKVNLDDGQYIARSGKRIPHTAARIAPPKIKKFALPDPPPVHVPVEPRRVACLERPMLIGGIKKPSFLRGRQISTKPPSSETEGIGGHFGTSYPEKPMTHTKLHFANLQDWNWYWETLPPTVSEKTQAQHFFTKKASPRFLQSVAFFRAFPESDVPEVAFVGRSNVGKSSLLNAIVNANTKALLARTSSTPGFTKTMNLYGLGPNGGVHYKKQPSGHGKVIGAGGITIVDMPGYGEGSLLEWGVEIMKYLQGRRQLRRVFVLIDAQHGIKDKDRSLLASLRLGGIPHQVVLSKLDKIYIPDARSIKRSDGKRLDKLKKKGSLESLRKTMEKLREEIQPMNGGAAIGEILGCSSEVIVDERRLGIDAVRFAMLQAIGFPFRTDQAAVERAAKEGPKVRTMAINLDEGKKEKQAEEPTVRRVVTEVTRSAKSDALSEMEAQLSAKERRAARRAGRR